MKLNGDFYRLRSFTKIVRSDDTYCQLSARGLAKLNRTSYNGARTRADLELE